jgi:hypothetical protein
MVQGKGLILVPTRFSCRVLPSVLLANITSLAMSSLKLSSRKNKQPSLATIAADLKIADLAKHTNSSLTELVHLVAKLDTSPTFFEKVFQVVKNGRIHTLAHEQLALILYSYAQSPAIMNQELFTIAKHILYNNTDMKGFSPCSIARILWAFAKVGLLSDDHSLFTNASKAIQKSNIHCISSETVYLIIQSLSFSGLQDHHLSNYISKVLLHKKTLLELTYDQLITVLYFYIKTPKATNTTFENICNFIVEQFLFEHFSIQQIIRTLQICSEGKCLISNDLIALIFETASVSIRVRGHGTISVSNLAEILQTFAECSIKDHILFNFVSNLVVTKCLESKVKVGAASKILNAFDKFRIVDCKLNSVLQKAMIISGFKNCKLKDVLAIMDRIQQNDINGSKLMNAIFKDLRESISNNPGRLEFEFVQRFLMVCMESRILLKKPVFGRIREIVIGCRWTISLREESRVTEMLDNLCKKSLG